MGRINTDPPKDDPGAPYRREQTVATCVDAGTRRRRLVHWNDRPQIPRWGRLLFRCRWRPYSLSPIQLRAPHSHSNMRTVLPCRVSSIFPTKSWLRPALAQANWMLGGGTCKFNAAEIVHGLTPLSEFKL